MASSFAPGAGLRRTRRVAMKQFCILLLSLFASAAFAADFGIVLDYPGLFTRTDR
jgi:hypothetical protein